MALKTYITIVIPKITYGSQMCWKKAEQVIVQKLLTKVQRLALVVIVGEV